MIVRPASRDELNIIKKFSILSEVDDCDELFNRSEYILVAVDDVDILGFITSEPAMVDRPPNIQFIQVIESHRNLDIGTKLVSEIESSYKEFGIKEITANVLIDSRPFFKKIGYTGEFYMRKSL
jgi:GNAT superfamily N-acetyltransferase